MVDKKSYLNMVVTDLDGTLFHGGRKVSETNFRTLVDLGNQKTLRVIATGRSLFSARKAIPVDFPIDYLIFSSGAGVTDWTKQELLKNHLMEKPEVETTFKAVVARDLDFMVHRPIPDNHFFVYFHTGRENPDFVERCNLYKDFASKGNTARFAMSNACQFVVVEPYTKPRSEYEDLKNELNTLKVIRATSPLDGRSTWIEVFPKGVSKSRAAAWIALIHQIERHEILAVGNDYNDLDLLKWTHMSFIVNNAPEELKKMFPVVSSNIESGFAEAVTIWKKRLSG